MPRRCACPANWNSVGTLAAVQTRGFAPLLSVPCVIRISSMQIISGWWIPCNCNVAHLQHIANSEDLRDFTKTCIFMVFESILGSC